MTRNRLLDGFAPPLLAEIVRRAAPFNFTTFREIPLSGDTLEFCWFPTGGVLIELAVLSDGSSAEIAIHGPESMVGTGPCSYRRIWKLDHSESVERDITSRPTF